MFKYILGQEILMSFREQVEKGLGCAVIIAGSGSDESHIEKIADSLEKYNIPFEVRIASAHKQPFKVLEIKREYEFLKGPLVYIAVAGGTDALSGIVSYHSLRPVISCPPDAPNQSCLTNPPGSSNAYIPRPENVARFIAQMFSYCNPQYAEAILLENCKKEASLQDADTNLREKFNFKE